MVKKCVSIFESRQYTLATTSVMAEYPETRCLSKTVIGILWLIVGPDVRTTGLF